MHMPVTTHTLRFPGVPWWGPWTPPVYCCRCWEVQELKGEVKNPLQEAQTGCTAALPLVPLGLRGDRGQLSLL